MNATIDLLQSHRSIRKFTDQKIPHELLLDLIRAGQCAATSNHVQAYSVIHVVNPDNRRAIAELAGGQAYIAECSDFLVFCADMKRSTEAAERAGADVIRGTTEQLVVASVDTALMAQNVAIAAESATFGLTEVRLGLIPATIAPFVLARIGRSHARRYLLGGERFDAAEAHRIGLVDDVVAVDALDAAIESRLEALLACGPTAVAECKALIRRVAEFDGGHQELDSITAEWIARVRVSDEGQAGLRAFLDKRRPEWNE